MEQRSSFVDADLLKCQICHQLPRDVVELSCCSSLFCWECLMKAPTGKCSVCGSAAEIEACQTSKLVQRIIDSIAFKCGSCQQCFKTSELLVNHKANCPVSVCACKYAQFGCDTQIQRKDYEAHLNEETAKHLDLLASHILRLQQQVNQSQQIQQQQQQQQQRDCCPKLAWIKGVAQKHPVLFTLLIAVLLLVFTKMGCFVQFIVMMVLCLIGRKLWRKMKCDKRAKSRKNCDFQQQQQHHHQHQAKVVNVNQK